MNLNLSDQHLNQKNKEVIIYHNVDIIYHDVDIIYHDVDIIYLESIHKDHEWKINVRETHQWRQFPCADGSVATTRGINQMTKLNIMILMSSPYTHYRI